ncbi:MAG: pilus assembly protein PilP [Gammaproteobacteria bacterium]|nr:pilus assembly protein PilP [Gammaproteobacteria bacterium]MDE2346588.1 pilus assembly protein PilP [Gammaproteobacteria bacterium]
MIKRQPLKSSRRHLGLVTAVCMAVLLAGCGSRMKDLEQYVAQVKARRGGQIAPLPQIKPFESYTYDDKDMRSPFIPQLQDFAKSTNGHNSSGLHPDFNRPRQYLEQFPLDSLKMMGSLTLKGVTYALIRDGDGVVHRVTLGNYMGQNYGKIIKISQAGLVLREIVPDGQGGWVERDTTVQLGG